MLSCCSKPCSVLLFWCLRCTWWIRKKNGERLLLPSTGSRRPASLANYALAPPVYTLQAHVWCLFGTAGAHHLSRRFPSFGPFTPLVSAFKDMSGGLVPLCINEGKAVDALRQQDIYCFFSLTVLHCICTLPLASRRSIDVHNHESEEAHF